MVDTTYSFSGRLLGSLITGSDGRSYVIPKYQQVDANGNLAPAGTSADPMSAQVQGPSAAGSPATGNPVPVAGVVRTADPSFASGTRNELGTVNNGSLLVAVGSASAFAAVVSPSDNNGSQNGLMTAARGQVYDGTAWRMMRGDTSGLFIGAVQFFTESTTALAASATFTGPSRSNGGTAGGVGSRFSFFIAEAFADQSGTVFIDKSVDGGTTWRQAGSVAVTAGTSATLKLPISTASYRARFVNGGTAQGAFLLTSAYSLN